MPFPRSKANCYEYSTHMPLAIRWGAKIKPGRKIVEFVSHTDFAPTFLEAAGIKPLPEMTGRSYLPMLLDAKPDPTRTFVHTERERHAQVRAGDLSYPMRALRTEKFLYIKNLRPEAWPAGDPEKWKAVGPFGDIDGGPTKTQLLNNRDDKKFLDLFTLACAKRPLEELYDLEKDPNQLHNVANYPEYAETLKKLRDQTQTWMSATNDPRATAGGAYDAFDKYIYTGDAPAPPKK
jgi:arylsulfatase A-like enzyme